MKSKIRIGVIIILLLVGTFSVWFILTNPPLSLIQTTKKDNVTMALSKDTYSRGEEVNFWLKNKGNTTITLSNSAPWTIEKWTGLRWNTIYAPVAIPTIVEVTPGERKDWSWNQQKEDGSMVTTGTYRITLWTEQITLTLVFKITE